MTPLCCGDLLSELHSGSEVPILAYDYSSVVRLLVRKSNQINRQANVNTLFLSAGIYVSPVYGDSKRLHSPELVCPESVPEVMCSDRRDSGVKAYFS